MLWILNRMIATSNDHGLILYHVTCFVQRKCAEINLWFMTNVILLRLVRIIKICYHMLVLIAQQGRHSADSCAFISPEVGTGNLIQY